MRLGIMQPYFMPYLGYFQLMMAVDKYVVFDDVNYIKRGWSARNVILINGEKHLFSIVVTGGSQNNLYKDVIVADDFVKFRKTLSMSYKKAPYFNDAMELLEKVFSFEDRRFGYFMKHSYELIMDYLGLKTELLLSSELDNDKGLKGKAKILDICKLIEADEYLNAIGGQDMYDKTEFRANGIELGFVKPLLMPYPQMSKEFVPGCSIIDALMMNSISELNVLCKSYLVV